MSKIKFLYVAIIFVVASSLFYVQDAQAYRAVKTISKVTAKADLPYWSDLKGCGKFKAQSQTTRTGFKKLHHDVSFYTVGGSVSAQERELQEVLQVSLIVSQRKVKSTLLQGTFVQVD